jgi:hypothetical protein
MVTNTRVCINCKTEKQLSDFYPSKETGWGAYCKSCCAKNYQEHRIEFLERQKIRRIERRNICLEHYGNQCACCGEKTKEFLAIDHINGGGSKHRKEIGRASIYLWIIKNNFPPIFRILCHNCNQAIGYYGICPHKRKINA